MTNVGALTINATNTVNLFGGTVTAASLTMGVNARLGFDIAAPGRLDATGNAALAGTLNLKPFTPLPAGSKLVYTFLTCNGSLSGSIALAGTLPDKHFANITTNTAVTPKALILTVWRPGGTLILVW
ncbi:MAG: hypothetical protein WCK89_07700 [bacterium]